MGWKRSWECVGVDRSLWGSESDKLIFPYPYNPDDGREQLQAPDDIYRVVRGGAAWGDPRLARCACRNDDGARDVVTATSEFAWWCAHAFDL